MADSDARLPRFTLFYRLPLAVAGVFVAILILFGGVVGAARASPPAHWMLFWMHDGDQDGIYVFDIERNLLERVADPPAMPVVDVPQLSANGHRVVFETTMDGRLQIYARDRGYPLYYTDSAVEDRLPAWSSDGLQLAFWSNRESPNLTTRRWQNWNFFIMDFALQQMRQITYSLGCVPYNNPSWSPDGAWITAQFWCSRDENGTFIINTQTNTVQSIRALVDAGGDLVWSPDGGSLAFRSDRERNGEIYVLTLNSGDLTNVTQHEGTDFQPAWSPDGSRLAFVSNRDGPGDIFVMNRDGSDARRLTNGGGWQPAWSPDGNWLTYTSQQDGSPMLYLVNSSGGVSLRILPVDRQNVFLGWYQASSP
jgi:Tol biopolymer transport system component